MNTKRFFALTLALLMALLLLPPAPARAEDTYPLTVEVSPAGAGTVTGGRYAPNSDFELVASPNQGWEFHQWRVMSGDVSVDDRDIPQTTGRTGSGFTGGRIEARFSRVEADVDIFAGEGGSVNSGDSGSYYYGNPIPLKATPDEGWAFDYWEYDSGWLAVADPHAAETTASVVHSGATDIKAHFKKVYPLTVEVFPAGAGTVTVSGGGDYAPGSDFELVATPNEGWKFYTWRVMSGDVSVNDPYVEWTTGRTGSGFTGGTIQADFLRIKAYVYIDADEGGSVNSGDSGTYSYGDSIPLKATPDEGWAFDYWEYESDWFAVADPHAAETTASVIVGDDGMWVSITACFKKIPYAVTVTADPAEGGTVTGAGSYTKGQTVALTATPNEGWKFKEWVSDDVTVAEDGTFDMPAKAVAVKAVFEVKPEYTLVSGAAPSYRLKSGQTLTFTIKRNVDDENCFTYFEGVTLDGAALATGTDYTAAPGSTVVTLKPAALDKLKTGDHTLIFSFTDGQAQTSVKIQAAYDDETGVGDNSHMFLWLAVALCGMMGLAALTVERKRLKQR